MKVTLTVEQDCDVNIVRATKKEAAQVDTQTAPPHNDYTTEKQFLKDSLNFLLPDHQIKTVSELQEFQRFLFEWNADITINLVFWHKRLRIDSDYIMMSAYDCNENKSLGDIYIDIENGKLARPLSVDYIADTLFHASETSFIRKDESHDTI